MNDLQILRQVQKLLRAAMWADSGLVFASAAVRTTMGLREEVIPDLPLPAALIRPGRCSADPDLGEQPGFERIGVVVSLVVANAQDQFGETLLVGANRTGGSDGRGLLEVKEIVKTTLLQLGPASGMPIAFRSSENPDPAVMQALGYVGYVDIIFEALGTSARTYQAPSGLARTGTTTAVLTWTASPRWDFRRFILRRASGSTPPATSTDGTGVTLGGSPDGAAAVGVTDSPGAGTWSYSLFAVYDDADAGSDVAVSAPQTLTVVVT